MSGEHYTGLIAGWYDDWLAARKDDVDFYCSYFDGFPGRVLELACGTGRLLVPIAKRGVLIDGLDSSEDMLHVMRRNAARAHLDGIEVHHQSMESFSLRRTFDAIFVASGSFQLLTLREDAMRSLTCIRNHLAENGFFLADISIPWDSILAQEESAYHVTRDVTRPNGKRSIVLERFKVDLALQQKLGSFRYEFYDHKRLVTCLADNLAIRWYWKDEFLSLLGEAGFSKVQTLTDSPLYKEGHSFVVKASK